jgi:putative ABC transport system permease protein
MLTITLRDLQWRARRFGLGVAAAGLVFSVTLLLAGVYSSFQSEATRTVAAFDADRWIVPAGVTGPFTASTPVSDAGLARVAQAPGVRAAEGVTLSRSVVRDGREERLVNVIGARPGGMFAPPLVAGRRVRRAGEALVDERMDVKLGSVIEVGFSRVRVVGLTRDFTYFAGVPAVGLSLEDGRRVAYQGEQLSSAVITRGVPQGRMPGLRAMTADDAIEDLRRPMRGASTTVAVEALLLSIVAAAIIGLMAYLSGLDRIVDFAVFKAIGVRTNRLLGGLVLEVVVLAFVAAAFAAVVARLLAPAFPVGVELSAGTYLVLLAVALGVSLLASLVSIRQAVRVDPALAFGRH